MDGYKLFRKDRQGRRGGGVALYVKECFEVTELMTRDDKVESLWVKIRGRACRADILVGICYRPPNQDEETDEVFYEQLAEAARSLALVLMGDFNFSNICWEYNIAQKKQSRWFLEYMGDNFLMQLVREPIRLNPYGLRSGEEPKRQTSRWASVIDLQTRMTRQMRCSMSSWRKLRNRRPLSSWGTSTSPTYAGNTI